MRLSCTQVDSLGEYGKKGGIENIVYGIRCRKGIPDHHLRKKCSLNKNTTWEGLNVTKNVELRKTTGNIYRRKKHNQLNDDLCKLRKFNV